MLDYRIRSEENRPGFHLDVLPALSSASYQEHQIDITEKNDEMYSWSTSNPEGLLLLVQV